MSTKRVFALRRAFLDLVAEPLRERVEALRASLDGAAVPADCHEDLGYLMRSADRLVAGLAIDPPADLAPGPMLGHASHSAKGALHPVCGFTDLCQGRIEASAPERSLTEFRAELTRTLVLAECFFDLPRWARGSPPLDLEGTPAELALGNAAATAAAVLGISASLGWEVTRGVKADAFKLGRALGVYFIEALRTDPSASIVVKEVRAVELGIHFSKAVAVSDWMSSTEGFGMLIEDARAVLDAHGAQIALGPMDVVIAIPFLRLRTHARETL
jgi:hypothetical protein